MKDQLTKLELMAENEKKLAKIYRLFSTCFPEEVDFFEELASEEESHAEVLLNIIHRAKTGTMNINTIRFSFRNIAEYGIFLDCLTMNVEVYSDSLKEALTLSHDMEKKFLESSFYEVIPKTNPAAVRMLSTLKEMTSHHRKKILKKIKFLG